MFSSSQSSQKLLQDETLEKQWLEKSNFDLKMKVYYLEEKLRMQNSSTNDDELKYSIDSSFNSLKIQLEEKEIELG